MIWFAWLFRLSFSLSLFLSSLVCVSEQEEHGAWCGPLTIEVDEQTPPGTARLPLRLLFLSSLKI